MNGFRKIVFANEKLKVIQVNPGIDYEIENGKKITIPNIQFSNSSVKTYVVERKIKSLKDKKEVIFYDFVFGNVDGNRLREDSEYVKVFSEHLDKFVNKSCRALPENISIKSKEEISEDDLTVRDKEENIYKYEFDKDMLDIIISGVLNSSHRSKISLEKTPPSKNINTFEMSLDEMVKVLEGRDEGVKKKKKFSLAAIAAQVDKEREEKRLRGRSCDEESVEEPEIKLDDCYVLFYPTGAVLIKTPNKLKGEPSYELVYRYDICYKTSGKSKPVRNQSILISNVNEKKLGEKGKYRDNFIEDICVSIIKYENGGQLYASKKPTYNRYVGFFNPKETVSIKRTKDKEIFEFFNGLDNELEELSDGRTID